MRKKHLKRHPSWTGGVAPTRSAERSDIGAGVEESKNKYNFNKILFSELLFKIKSTTPALIRLHLRCILIRATPPVQEGSLYDGLVLKKFICLIISPDTCLHNFSS